MTGTNYFTTNAGGTVINLASSNLTITGNLTVKDGNAFDGGAIRLDSTSSLFLQEPLTGRFYNNTADRGSAIFAPYEHGSGKSSPIQIVSSKMYSLNNILSIQVFLYFSNNTNGQYERSIYAPGFGIFGKQNSPNFTFAPPSSSSIPYEPATWDFNRNQYAYSTLVDAILYMEKVDKFTSLSNGLCLHTPGINDSKYQWECRYIDAARENTRLSMYPQCHDVPYMLNAYPGETVFGARSIDNQVYTVGVCQQDGPDHNYHSYKHWSSLLGENSILTFTLNLHGNISSDSYILFSYSDVEVDIISLPFLEVHLRPCPVGFCMSDYTCVCDKSLQANGYTCDINDGPSFSGQEGYWTGFGSMGYRDISHARILFGHHCPPRYCNESRAHILRPNDDLTLSCVNDRTGVLCGTCKYNYSIVFGSDTCHDDCSNLYLLTLPVYALVGVLLVVVLFALRLTVASGTFNGIIFYANLLGLVMDRLTEGMNHRYVNAVHIIVSFLNLNLGFPLCLYKRMDMAAKVGFQFVFPTYLWSIILALVVISRFSVWVSNLISSSSVQVLTTLFYLSFTKLLRTVIMIVSHSSIHSVTCDDTNVSHVWFYDGDSYYGLGPHAILLAIALIYTVVFLLPYCLLVTFSSFFVRFRLVNKFKPFIDAYGGPFKDKWRFWFGFRLWIIVLLFGLDGALEGTDSHKMFVVQSVVIIAFILLQVFVRPFKNRLIGLLDAFFMVNYWLLIDMYMYSIFFKFEYLPVYISLTGLAIFVMTLVLLLHVCALKFPEKISIFRRHDERSGYESININDRQDSDVDLFRAAEERVPVVDTY